MKRAIRVLLALAVIATAGMGFAMPAAAGGDGGDHVEKCYQNQENQQQNTDRGLDANVLNGNSVAAGVLSFDPVESGDGGDTDTQENDNEQRQTCRV